jgi:quercetin dioxygenase-like cupin family protein
MQNERPLVVDERTVPLESSEGFGRLEWRTLFSADRTPTAGLTVGVVDIPTSASRPLRHRHDPAEVYYVLGGHGWVDIDGVVTEVATGHAIYIPGGAWHCAWSERPGGIRLLYAFAVDSFSEVVYEFE